MHYEITNRIDPSNPTWLSQRQRLLESDGSIITLAPNPGLRDQLVEQKINGFNIIDYITQRTIDYDPQKFMFFNKVPTVTGSEIFMSEDFSIDIIYDGNTIGHVVLWPILRRHVKQIIYTFPDGTNDFTEEIASDGRKYSNIIFNRNEVQRIDFYNDEEHAVVRFYFYENNLNYITVGNSEDLLVTNEFHSLEDFFAFELGRILTEDDTVSINYMGIELVSLSKSKSKNTLHLVEDPLSPEGKVKGNLMGILTNKIKFIQNVTMTYDKFEKLLEAGAPTSKITIE